MSNNEHPITPPPELVREWAQFNGEKDLERFWLRLATQAARWGYEQRGAVNEAEPQQARDEEFEACCEMIVEALRFLRPAISRWVSLRLLIASAAPWRRYLND